MNDADHVRMLWIGVAGMAGSITGLSFMPWKTMSWPERILTLVVGFSFATFAVPWIAVDYVKVDLNTLRAACGAAYLGGTVANAMLPLLIRRSAGVLSRWMDRLFGKEEEA